MKTMTAAIVSCLLLSLFFQSCSSRMYMTPVSMVKPDSLLQITDEQIKEVLQTKAQLTKPLIVAVYNASFENYPILDSLERLDGISSVFSISPWMVEGSAYRERAENPWYRWYRNPAPTPVKSVRLEAARGKADMLIYIGITQAYNESMNYLAWGYIGLLTVGFVPGQNIRLTTTVDMIFIDVRNGYLYGSYHDENSAKKNYVTVDYVSSDEFKKFKRAQVSQLLPGMLKATGRILNNKAFYLDSGVAKTTDLR